MKMKIFLSAMALGAMLTSAAFAQTVTPVAPNTVKITGTADMKSIADQSKRDSFDFTVEDAQIKTRFVLECTGAGHNELLFVRKNRECATDKTSIGALFNPKTSTWMNRTQYVGGYTVEADKGLTQADGLAVNYLALGANFPAQPGVKFGGSLNLKPEQSSQGAMALTQKVLNNLTSSAEGLTNKDIDTVDFNHLVMPSTGLPANMDPGVTWTGNATYAYQTYSWYFQVVADFKGQSYQLTGNMPFTGDSESEGGISNYDVVLTLPSTAAASATAPASYDDLFADASQGADLFATADGIIGNIKMTNTKITTTPIGDKTIETPAYVVADGSFTGQGVPIEVVRSFVDHIALLPATYFGP